MFRAGLRVGAGLLLSLWMGAWSNSAGEAAAWSHRTATAELRSANPAPSPLGVGSDPASNAADLAAARHPAETDLSADTPDPDRASETATAQPASPTPTPQTTPASPGEPLPTPSPDSTPTPGVAPGPSATPESGETPNPTHEPTWTPILTLTSSPTVTADTVTPSPTPVEVQATQVSPQVVLINEVAWAGTQASASDEWIELHNPGPLLIDLSGWHLSDGEDIQVTLSGTIAPYGFFVLERTDDSTIGNQAAQLLYSGSLNNAGERLELRGPSGELVDSANQSGSTWPAGDSPRRASMERRGGADLPGNWGTYSGSGGPALDAAGMPIHGTPGGVNSFYLPTPTPSPTPLPHLPQALLINEVAWSGTRANASDEWIELHNPGSEPIQLSGWQLTDGGDIGVSLAGSISPYGYYLLERSDDQTVSDVAADQIYSGGLNNTGEVLWLLGPGGELVDSANANGGPWPAGSEDSRASMERWGGADLSGNWGSFTGYHSVGHDAAGNFIRGTPRSINSLFFPTPVPTWIPGRVVINEVLIRPRHDWEGTGGVSTADEFIELYNHGPGAVYLRGWWVDDVADGGSNPGDLPGVTIPEHGFAVFFRSFTGVALNDDGDVVRLLAPNGRLIDEIRYLPVRAYNLSYGRLPDGSNQLAYGLWPTPGDANLLFEEPIPPLPQGPFYAGICRPGSWPAGGRRLRASMERRAVPDGPGSWVAFAGNYASGRDAKGNPIAGTPREVNWALGPAGRLARRSSDLLSAQTASPSRGEPGSFGAVVALGPDADRGLPTVLINEVAWAGTRANATDEWIELYNPGTAPVYLVGWRLTDRNDLDIELKGTLDPGAYYLLERTDDTAVSNLTADLIYTGRLEDAGETLWLLDPVGAPVDSANSVGPGAPRPLLARAARGPTQLAWLRSIGMVTCQ